MKLDSTPMNQLKYTFDILCSVHRISSAFFQARDIIYGLIYKNNAIADAQIEPTRAEYLDISLTKSNRFFLQTKKSTIITSFPP